MTATAHRQPDNASQAWLGMRVLLSIGMASLIAATLWAAIRRDKAESEGTLDRFDHAQPWVSTPREAAQARIEAKLAADEAIRSQDFTPAARVRPAPAVPAAPDLSSETAPPGAGDVIPSMDNPGGVNGDRPSRP